MNCNWRLDPGQIEVVDEAVAASGPTSAEPPGRLDGKGGVYA
jgi:hypothetical protein